MRLLGVKSHFDQYAQKTAPKYTLHSEKRPDVDCWFVSFAAGHADYENKLIELAGAASLTKWFSKVIAVDEAKFSSSKLGMDNEAFAFIQANRERGFGYWLWKPMLLRYYLNEAPAGCILVYSDVGNEISPAGTDVFWEMLRRANQNDCLFFQMPFIERHWTKSGLLEKFRETDKATGQISATFFMIKKCDEMIAFVDRWAELASENSFGFITDPVAREPLDFIEHRHDQSILSYLVKTFGHYHEPQVDHFDRRLYADHRNDVHKFPIHTLRTRSNLEIYKL